jgi:hypothetical protein
MTDTVDTDIVTTGWTEVQEDTSGLITNGAEQPIVTREAASDPGASVTTGHFLKARESMTYNLDAGQSVWARAIQADTFVLVTGA